MSSSRGLFSTTLGTLRKQHPQLFVKSSPLLPLSCCLPRSKNLLAIRWSSSSTTEAQTVVQETRTHGGYLPSKAEGSYHWAYERGLSILTVPLIVSAIALPDTYPLIDMGLAVVLTAHTHIGFDAIITDYLPVRRAGIIGYVSPWILRIASVLALYGLYTFNTNDIGITEFCRRLWAGKPRGFVLDSQEK